MEILCHSESVKHFKIPLQEMPHELIREFALELVTFPLFVGSVQVSMPCKLNKIFLCSSVGLVSSFFDTILGTYNEYVTFFDASKVCVFDDIFFFLIPFGSI